MNKWMGEDWSEQWGINPHWEGEDETIISTLMEVRHRIDEKTATFYIKKKEEHIERKYFMRITSSYTPPSRRLKNI